MAAEFGIALGANLVTECVKSISRTIKQQILYVFKYQSYTNDLNTQVQKLRHKTQREQLRVDHAIRQGDDIHTDVAEWLTKVNQFIGQVENERQANTSCFKGLCPNLVTRYKVGKKAVKTAKAASDLLGKEFQDVSRRPGPQRTASMYVRDYEAFDSREVILQEIMEALKDANVNSIGVYGMGGVGKTILVNKVAWQVIEDKLFDDVVIAEVTQKPDKSKIQQKIASDLGLLFEQHENEFDRAHRLRNRLKKGKSRVLVILDNIWAKPDFEAIGIPFGGERRESALNIEDCKEKSDDDQMLFKILLTSRSLDVLRNDANIEKNFLVETLSPEESENLFWRIVGEYHSAKSSTDFQTVAEIVVKCAGLPLAIATIANALKNKSIDAWEHALDQLRTANPRSIPEVDERVVSVLEFSFNLLQSDEAKKLFLLCSLIDCGHGTSHDYLLRYTMGWGLFQNVYTLETGRKRLHMLIENLKASCLLLEGESHNWVKMHEFVHAVAMSIAATSKLMLTIQDVPDLNKVLEEKISENPTAISLPYRDISELPETLGCPKLELFFLFMNSPSLQIPNNFFEGMKQLKVIDCDCINLQLLPSSFRDLTNLQTLCLDGCLLGDVSNIGEIKNLEILSFSRSSIEKLPKEIGKLTRLKLLDLSRCFKFKVIAPNVISSLSRLEELYLDDTPVQWENELDNQDGSNANLDELNQLSLLTTLRMTFLDAQIIPPNLCFQQLKRYRILIGDVWSWSNRNEASRTLKLKINSSSCLGYKPIKVLLKRTEDLFLDELNGVQNVLHELDEEGFPNLKHLHVRNGFELLYIVNSEGRVHYNAFQMLEELCLTNLINLENICHGPLKETSFNKLRTVKVKKCDGLKHLFSISMAKSLSKLQEIEVTDCENLKVIFAEEDDEGCVHDDRKIEFGQLRSLTLQRLPQFTNFSFNMKTLLATNTPSTEITTADDHEDYTSLFGKRVKFPSLENLKLSLIGIEMIWPEQLLSIASYCQTVKSLTLEDCNGLKFLFSSSMVRSFAQLQRLVLCNCESMEQVLHAKGLGEESISFPNLFYLELKDLPKLTRFGNGNIIEFPSLNVLIIVNCPNFRTFFSNNTSTDMAANNEPEEVNSMENLQADKPLFGDKVGCPSLEVLVVLQMHNLRKIWEHQLSSESFCKIKILRVKDCNKLLNIFPFDMLGRLQILESLEVMNCDSLEEVFEFRALSGQMTPAIEAAQVGELHLCHLPNLKHVWDMDSQAILAFYNLLKIRVHSCPGLKSLFPASIANDLHKLEELEIRTCLLEEIIAKDVNVEGSVVPRFRFPRLTSLTLHCLSVLKAFYPKTHISEWPALKKMEVSGCTTGCGTVKILVSELQSPLAHLQPLFLVDKVAFPSLEVLKLAHLPELLHLWGENSHTSRVFQNLVTLEISACEKLKTLVPSSLSLWNLETLDVSRCDELVSLVTLPTAKSLVNLTRMDIADCKMIEEIITHVGDGGNHDNQVVLKQLNYLRLHQLSSLTSFCRLGNYAIKWPSLEKVIVGHCPKMAMMEKVHLKEAYDQENLDTTGQQLFKEMVGFQSIKYLKISEFPQLKKIWHEQLLPGSFFCNLMSLVVDNCADMSSAISGNLVQSLNKLEMLEVRNCDSLEQVFDLEELNVDRHPGLLTQLSHFYLIDLPKLSHLCRSRQELLGLKNLTFLEVQNCGGLRYIFTEYVFSGFKQLKEMKIVNCPKLEGIVAKEGEEDVADKIVVPLLKSVILESLPDLTSFYSGNSVLECPSLNTITITNCTKMEAFVFPTMKDRHLQIAPFFSDKVVLPALEKLELSSVPIEMIYHSKLPATSCIQSLIFLVVNGCDKLRYLFPSSTVKSLGQLQQVMISECKSIEAAILMEEEGMSEMMIFSRLRVLRLVDLPSLKMFCNCTGNLTVFPVLSSLVIDKCGGMKTFVSNSISAIAQGSAENINSNIPLFDEKVVAPNLEKLVVYNMDNLGKIWDDHLTLNSFSKLQDLRVGDCCKLMIIFPSVMHGRLQALHTFMVVNCESLEEIFEVQVPGCGRTDAIAVGQLREIHLCELPNLKHAWNLDAQAILSPQHLHSLQIHYCYNLKFLFPASIARDLLQLRELEIKSCPVEEIVAKEEVAVEIVPKFVFPQLTSLSLKDLPGLKSFYPGIHISEWPALNKLETYGCDKVKIFASEFQNHGESQHDIPIQTLFLVDKIVSPALEKSFCFRHVTNLTVDGCGDLKHLFTAAVVKSLVHLKILSVSNCNVMEGVIVMEKERISEKLFPKLHQLMVKDLPKLKRFCNFSGDLIELFILTVLVIDNCPNMETFVSNSMCADMTRNEPDKEMNSEDNLQAETQPLFDEKVSLPHLEKLIVRKMDNLRKIWDENQHNLDSFSKLLDMWVGSCNKLLNIFPSSMHGRLQRLEVLKVLNCDSVEEIFNLRALSGQERNFVIASQMRELQLHHLPNLKHVYNMHNPVILGFQNLLAVQAHHSNNLESSCMMDEIVRKDEEVETVCRFMFPQLTSLMLVDLPRLECFYPGIHIIEWPVLKQLVVHDCAKVETLLASGFLSLQENREECQQQISVQHPLFLVDKVALPSLEQLELSKLPELLHLWKENSQPSEVFQNLATLKVSECDKLMNILPTSVSINNLTTLEVSKCDGLKSLVTAPTARSLMQLTRMDIVDCKRIEEIVTVTDMENAVKNEMAFKELGYLVLECLPSLRSFCLGNCTLKFPSLDQVIVRECSKMEAFSKGVLSTPKLQRVQLTEGEDGGCWKGDLNTTIEHMFKEMNAQISTED